MIIQYANFSESGGKNEEELVEASRIQNDANLPSTSELNGDSGSIKNRSKDRASPGQSVIKTSLVRKENDSKKEKFQNKTINLKYIGSKYQRTSSETVPIHAVQSPYSLDSQEEEKSDDDQYDRSKRTGRSDQRTSVRHHQRRPDERDFDSWQRNVNLTDCYYYYNNRNGCNKGKDCNYRHEPAAKSSTVVCADWGNGNCTEHHCSNR